MKINKINKMELLNKLNRKGIKVISHRETGCSIDINAKSTFSEDANVRILYELLPEGTFNGKDVNIKLNENEQIISSSFSNLNEGIHPDKIDVGDRITIEHKTFGKTSVVVKKIKRWNSQNALDGVYYYGKKHGIMGFISFDNIIRFYKYEE